MFMTAWVFEARHCPTLLNEIKKTKLQIYTSPQAGINILCMLHNYIKDKEMMINFMPCKDAKHLKSDSSPTFCYQTGFRQTISTED